MSPWFIKEEMALSKNKQKLIASLAHKKYRDESGLFVAEGTKLVLDLLEGGLHCHLLAATPEWLAAHPAPPADEVAEATEEELRRASSQKTPQGVLAVLRKPADTPDPDTPARDLCLALDDVQDPGNLGTIVRVADWFGLRDVFCSRHSADVYGAKTVQATMGALARVRVHYVDLPALLARCREAGLPVYGTFMDGDSLYAAGGLEARGVIVMGNEGNGISPEVGRLVSHRLLIPSYPPGAPTCESLNVGVAAAIVCAEFRRRAAAGE